MTFTWLVLFIVLVFIELVTVNLVTIWFAIGSLVSFFICCSKFYCPFVNEKIC